VTEDFAAPDGARPQRARQSAAFQQNKAAICIFIAGWRRASFLAFSKRNALSLFRVRRLDYLPLVVSSQ
jgi:hypothetical protein